MGYYDNVDSYQRSRDEPIDGDDELVPITRVELGKCAAIVDAYAGGLDLYRGAADTVAVFLHARLAESIGGRCTPSAEQAWEQLRAIPWPPPRSLWPEGDR